MKKLSLIVLCICMLIPFVSQASKPDCDEFVITLQNNTSYDCVLKSSKILTGYLFEDSKIPGVIFRGHKEEFLMSRADLNPRYDGLHGASIYLRYQCGDNKEVSLLSYLPNYLESSYFSPPKVIGSVLDSQSINISSVQTNPKKCSVLFVTSPASIEWTLTNDSDE